MGMCSPRLMFLTKKLLKHYVVRCYTLSRLWLLIRWLCLLESGSNLGNLEDEKHWDGKAQDMNMMHSCTWNNSNVISVATWAVDIWEPTLEVFTIFLKFLNIIITVNLTHYVRGNYVDLANVKWLISEYALRLILISSCHLHHHLPMDMKRTDINI